MKKYLLLTMIMLLSISLFSMSNIYATTPNQQNSEINTNINNVNESAVDVNKDVNISKNIQNTTVGNPNGTQTVIDPVKNQQKTISTTKPVNYTNNLNNSNDSSVNIQNVTEAAGNVNNYKVLSKAQTTTVKYNVGQIEAAAILVKNFINSNLILPSYVQIGSRQVTMPEFLQLLTAGLIQVKSGLIGSLALHSAVAPTNLTSNTVNGIIKKSEYLNIAGRINSFINTNGKAPNYASSSLGKIQFKSLVYMFSRIMSFHGTKNVLPVYATMNSWPSTSNNPAIPIPAALQIYINPTINCQSNNPTIVAIAKSITMGSTNTNSKAIALFNWVRDNIDYSFYYNSQNGALRTLTSKTANCCDTSNLLIALSRAAGIPARYISADCDFSGTWYGHVYAQLYVGGTWHNADATSNRNIFGVINNWDTSNMVLKGVYAQLPF
jgi:hypothetical protein